MSAKWMGYFFDDTELEGSELLLALAIADHADADGIAHPGISLLAKKIRLKERRTQDLIKRLEVLGYIKITRKTGRGNLSIFQLKRVHSNAPFNTMERVHPTAPFTKEKGCNLGHKKGAIPCTERVQSGALSLNKDEPLIEPYIKPEREDPTPSEFGAQQNVPEKRFFHPALKAIRDITKSNPDKVIWDDLIDTLGLDFDLARLEKCFRAWRLKGYKAANYGWITDWYVNGSNGEYTNGTGQRLSEREKSATRRANADKLADELERIGYAEVAAELAAAEQNALPGRVGTDNFENHLVSKRPVANRS